MVSETQSLQKNDLSGNEDRSFWSLCGADHHALDLAVITELLDGGDGTDVVAVVDGVVVSLGVADDLGIGNLELAEQELVPEEHVDALRAVGVDQGAARILGAVVHKDGSLRENLAQGNGVPVDHSVYILSDQSHGFSSFNKPFRN